MPNPTYTLIKGETLTSSTTSYSFTAIPSTFTDLVLRVSHRVSSANPINGYNLRFNSDSSTIYSYIYAANRDGAIDYNYGSGADAVGNAIVNGGTSTANTFTSFELYLPNYTSTISKQFSYVQAIENNSASSNDVQFDAGLYRNTSAITSISFSNATFVTGSSFYLYGIKSS
jgi:hypothetical protein